MKHLLLFVVAASLALTSNARNFYFSNNSGDDSRTTQQAQSASTPWKSLSKLNSIFSSLQAGDSVLFKRGEVFYGSFVVTRSGNASAPIVISAYGTGARPEFTGFTQVNNWYSVGNNVWESDCPASQGLNTVLIDGSLRALGRYPNPNTPNGGHFTIESHSGKNSITDNELTSSTNWTGAEIIIRKNEWIYDRAVVTAHSGTTVNFDNTSGYEPLDYYGYFFQNDPRTLDMDGEWYFNAATHKLRIFSVTNPSGRTIKASTVDNMIVCGAQNYITFDNIKMTGANLIALKLENANNITVQNSEIVHSGTFGVKAFVTNGLTIQNSDVNFANSNGIYAAPFCSNTVIRNNKVHNIGLLAGMGNSNNQTYEGIVVHGTDNLVELNRLDSIGYVAIRFYGDNFIVQKNFIKDFALTKDDGGGIYTNGDIEFFNQKILNNVIINGIGNAAGTNTTVNAAASGIYCDDRTANVEISGNTLANCSENGIFLHNAHEIELFNNTMFNNKIQTGMVHDVLEPHDPIRNIVSTGNKLFSKTATQVAAHYESTENDIAEFGNFDRNFYCRPVNESLLINTRAVGNHQVFNLEGWQSTYNKDWNAKKTPMEIPAFSSKPTGSNLFANGTFNSNVNGASSFSVPYYSTTTWANDGKLDGGSLKVGYNTSMGNVGTADVILMLGNVTAGKTYVLNFSMMGINTDADFQVFLRNNADSYNNLSEVIPFKNANTRTEKQFLFHTTASSTHATLVFKVNGADCPLYLDNISLYEAAITMNNVDEYVRFEYNGTNAPVTVALDGTYMDLEKNQYAHSITLAPFSSVILMEMEQATLPLKFVEFKGKKNSQNVDLKWITANEINTNRFEIERSSNGTDFTKIGNVASSNVATGTSNYSFTDFKPLVQNNYYRLKQIDKDGKSAYSDIVVINFSSEVKMTLSPNPVVEKINISLSTPQTNQKAVLSIHSVAGVTVKTMPVTLSSEAMSVNVSTLPAGLYIVHIASENGLVYNERFVKN